MYLLVPVLLAVPGLLVLKTRRSLYAVGFMCTIGVFVFGSLVTLFFSTIAGPPRYESMLSGGLLTCLATMPFLATTLIYGRYLKQKPKGYCPSCSYDLRGNVKAKHCSECGNDLSG